MFFYKKCAETLDKRGEWCYNPRIKALTKTEKDKKCFTESRER